MGLQHLTVDDIEATVAPYKWSPPATTLGDGTANGSTVSLNLGAGTYVNFDAASDDEYLFNISLDRNGIAYDGSDIDLEVYFMKFGSSGGNIKWEIDYSFVSVGEDAYLKRDGTLVNEVDVTALADQTLTNLVIGTVNGAVGSKILQITLRRNSTGAGADTYIGDAEVYGFNLE